MFGACSECLLAMSSVSRTKLHLQHTKGCTFMPLPADIKAPSVLHAANCRVHSGCLLHTSSYRVPAPLHHSPSVVQLRAGRPLCCPCTQRRPHSGLRALAGKICPAQSATHN